MSNRTLTAKTGQFGASPAGLAMDPEVLVRLRNVSYTYPTGVTAVRDLDIDIRRGEVMSLIGPSGCGKSTLIAIVSGLRRASGEVTWNPEIVASTDPRERRLVNVVFQRDTVMPWLSVQRNVAFGLKFLRIGAEERAHRVEELLEMGGLADFRHAHPHELSGGMRRRVALLTGMAARPRLLILDEPFSALDEPTRIGLHADLLRMSHEMDMSVLLVTHDLSEAVSLSDEVCVFTKRPGTVATKVAVPLGRDRDMTSLRSTSVYTNIYQGLWQSLWDQIGGLS